MTLKIGNKGFTLIEVMVTTVVLSLGTVLIYGAFFTSLDAFNRYTNYLNLIPWMDEQLWQAQDGLNKFGALAQLQTTGEFQKSGKTFSWGLNYSLIDGGLYKIDLDLYWQQGQRKAGLSRSAYAEYKKKE
ncbi:MAG: prepilin-type N-terminal cleavage/methylation domain-containing protein [Candidatus Omnitrophica bacterium]|nr:prepilin-type N-terminal cleavage/methylation domain-containing protein [Candidatus Omnitrophota bacterium]MDD5477070.1 prepilin-type N-terminal cleavage/methylation domain-containing protein [Candidatus Omnitrophota bacterium]